MTQEEKVRAYDEALSVALETYKTQPMYKDWLEKMFPELRESDDDKIRKALIEMVHDTTGDSLWVDYNVHKEDAIAWLEKQANHANFRNKIQIGDKVTKNRDGYLVNLSQLNRVAKVDEKQGEQKPTDEEMKTLLQTEYEKEMADTFAEMQKSWSEEDEEMLKMVIKLCEQCGNEYAYYWLKSLKDRVQPRNKWKPSKEQIEILDMVLTNETMDDNIARILRELREQLKKLRE